MNLARNGEVAPLNSYLADVPCTRETAPEIALVLSADNPSCITENPGSLALT